MSLLTRIKEFIGRHHLLSGGNEEPPREPASDFWVDRYRRMTPAERAETLESAANQWEVENHEDLEYKTSLVDLMKLTAQDFSLKHRRELAKEVGWDGDVKDTAAMNKFLYPIVLKRLEIVY
jgi:hypothetical protein